MRTRYLLFLSMLISIGISSQLRGQERQSEELKGQVIDRKDKIPVVFATIQFKGSTNGFITNEDGYFRIPYSSRTLNDTLRISSIGYATREIAVSELDDSNNTQILLSPKVEALNEIVVTADKSQANAWDLGITLVKKAIVNIPKNYPTEPHSYVGYYRDYQLVENQYFNLNEAVVEVFDGGFQTNKLLDKRNETILYEYITNDDFPRDEMLAQAYNKESKYISNVEITNMGGNELSILNLHNPIRNFNTTSFSFIDIFRLDFVKNHTFKAFGISYLNDEPLYEVRFRNRDEDNLTEGFSATGKIYISSENYAIHKLEYYVAFKNRPFYSLRLEYAPKGDFMHLNYISFNNFFKVSGNNFIVKDIALNTQENAFYVTLSNPVKEIPSINSRNFRFLFKKRKLSIDSVTLNEPNVMKVKLAEGTLPSYATQEENLLKNITYKIKNVVDVKQQKLGENQTIKANQFRELFVQEVFPDKQLPQDSIFIMKTRPMVKTVPSILKNADKYWINTPLKSSPAD